MGVIYVIDDNVFHREAIQKYINEELAKAPFPFLPETTIWEPEDVLARIVASDVGNIYFLDIDLQLTVDGIDVATAIREKDPNGYIVFVTSHHEKLRDVMNQMVEPIAYIVKEGQRIEQVKQQVQQALQVILKRQQTLQTDARLQINQANLKLQLAFADIVYVETVPTLKKSIIHTVTEEFVVNKTVKALKAELVADHMFHGSSSYIINTDFLLKIDKLDYQAVLKDGTIIPIGIRATRLLTKFLYKK